MTHTVEDRDGMRVLVVTDLGRRFHPDTGKELDTKRVDAALVHSTEIARYYGLPHNSIFDNKGEMVEAGVWQLVHGNTIGLRVNYNSDEKRPDNIDVRRWDRIMDSAGHVIDTKERIDRLTTHDRLSGVPGSPVTVETDDGIYARYDDVIRYAKANGWTQGAGWPKKQAVNVQQSINPAMLAQIVAATTQAVIAALGDGSSRGSEEPPKQKRVLSPEHLAKMAAGRAAAKTKKDG